MDYPQTKREIFHPLHCSKKYILNIQEYVPKNIREYSEIFCYSYRSCRIWFWLHLVSQLVHLFDGQKCSIEDFLETTVVYNKCFFWFAKHFWYICLECCGILLKSCHLFYFISLSCYSQTMSYITILYSVQFRVLYCTVLHSKFNGFFSMGLLWIK